MRCTHNCSTCKCKIKDVNGYDACCYISFLKNKSEYTISVNVLDGDALYHYNNTKLLYFFDDGLYLYSPVNCFLQRKNYKFIALKYNNPNGNNWIFEKKDENWIIENAKKTILDKKYKLED